jgi:hypothetical protein
MELKCKVLRVGQTEQVSDKFKKRELIVEYAENPTYPQTIKFEASQDKCDKLDALKVGDEINLHYNLNGREWTDKTGNVQVFNTLSIWKFDVVGSAISQPSKTSIAKQDEPDLPF